MKKAKYLLTYNLQFFAKDGPGGEKTEEPTSKKLSDTRKEGNVAKSKELVNAISLIGIFVLLKVWVGKFGTSLMGLFHAVYRTIPTFANVYADELTIDNIVNLMIDVALEAAILLIPIFAIGFLIAFLGDFFQFKWQVTTKPLMPKLDKINPLKGFKRIFSMQSVVNLLKSLALIIIISYLVYQTIISKISYLYNFYEIPLMEAIGVIGNIVIDLGIKIGAVYLVVGIADFAYQKIKFKKDMMMTKQEVKDEYKNAEGDPQIKGKIRQRMMQASRQRMMQELPKADVVITNPTHYAVALQYDLSIAKAPRVIAKGEDFLAQRIKEVAREHQIELVENKPLARALYANVEIGEEIPEELYQAVAEVLAYVYNIKNKTVER